MKANLLLKDEHFFKACYKETDFLFVKISFDVGLDDRCNSNRKTTPEREKV